MSGMPDEIWVKRIGYEYRFCTPSNRAYSTRYTRAPQWQPIETAPKDGTKIVVFNPDREEPEVAWYVPVVFHLDDGEDSGVAWPWKTYDNAYKEEWPDHWQPIPKPPEIGQNE